MMDPWMVIQLIWAPFVIAVGRCYWEKFYIPPDQPRKWERLVYIDVRYRDADGEPVLEKPIYAEFYIPKEKVLTPEDEAHTARVYNTEKPHLPYIRPRRTGPIYNW